MQNLSNKTALITGGSKGIGYGIAASLVAEGCNVSITSRSQENADQAAEKLSKEGEGKILPLAADVRDFEDQLDVAKKTLDEFGQIDYVLANAGLGHYASIEDLTEEQWKETIDTNLTGLFFTIKSTVAALKDSQGYFISIASLAGTNFFPKGSAYNASKFGAVGFTQSIMLDLRQAGISVSTIMPGSVSTQFNGNDPEENPENEAWKIQPEDIGELVVDMFKLNKRSLPSKIEIRPSKPPKK